MNKQDTVPSVQIGAEVTRLIRQHARSSMTTEVCGVLIGDLRGDVGDAVDIFAAIAAVNATQAGTHVTFTQDAWEHIYKIKDAEYPEARIVGWYHSHPGFGVFLSEHDTFIQENFFSAANQVAWVFDPHTDEEGCFGWVDGKIVRLESITIVDSDAPANVAETRELMATPEVGIEEEDESPTKGRRVRVGPPPRWLRWTASISALLAMLVLGFAISHFLAPALYPLVLPMNPLTGQPLLHDTKTDQPVFMDPQRHRYVTVDPHSGRLVPVGPESIKAIQPTTENNPFLQPPQAPAMPEQAPAPMLPKEKK